jgi:hypothetical protein
MIVTPIAPDPKRDAAAAALVATAPWPRVTLTKPVGSFEAGAVFYRVPSSQDGIRYVANAMCCTCADAQRAGNVYKHSRAVRLAEQAEFEVEQQLADVVCCRRCGDRIQRPGCCRPCRERVLGYDD